MIEDRLTLDKLAADGLITIDNAVLRQALPPSVFVADPGAPRVRPAAAFYAPDPEYELSASLVRPEATVAAHHSVVLTASEKALRATGAISLVPSREKLFALRINVPAGWRIAELTTSDGKELSFDF